MAKHSGRRSEEAFRIGAYLVRPSLNEVSGDSESQRLNPKAMSVLIALVDAEGKVVSKDGLLDLVWGEKAIGEDVVANAVYELRRAFGDDARNPRYIETIPRRGYRLVAAIRGQPTGRPGLNRKLVVAVAAGVIAVGVVAFCRVFDCAGADTTLSVELIDVVVEGADERKWRKHLERGFRQALDSPVLRPPRTFRQAEVGVVVTGGGGPQVTAVRTRLEGESLGVEIPSELALVTAPMHELIEPWGRRLQLELELRAHNDPELRQQVERFDAKTIRGLRALEEANALADDQLYDEARRAYDDLIETEPTFLAAYRGFARMQDNRGNKEGGRDKVRKAMKLVEQEDAGLTAIEKNLGGETGTQVWLELEQRREELTRRRLKLDLRLARIDDLPLLQIELLEELYDLGPRDDHRFERAWVLAALLKDCPKALGQYEAIRNSLTGFRLLHYAQAVFICDDPDRAVAMLEENDSLRQEDIGRDGLAYFYLLLGRHRELEEILGELEASLASSDAYMSREPIEGMLLAARGRYREAIWAIDSYLGRVLGPTFKVSGAFRKAQILLAQSESLEGEEKRQRLLDIVGLHEDALDAYSGSFPVDNYSILGLAHLGLGDLAEAERIAEQIGTYLERTENHDGMQFYFQLLGEVRLSRGQRQLAIEAFEKAVDQERPYDRAHFLQALAAAHAALGEHQRAIEVYQEALEFNPNHFRSLCELGEVQWQMGRREEARRQLRRCLTVLGDRNEEEALAALARKRLNLATQSPSSGVLQNAL